jgi:hypothetical protein
MLSDLVQLGGSVGERLVGVGQVAVDTAFQQGQMAGARVLSHVGQAWQLEEAVVDGAVQVAVDSVNAVSGSARSVISETVEVSKDLWSEAKTDIPTLWKETKEQLPRPKDVNKFMHWVFSRQRLRDARSFVAEVPSMAEDIVKIADPMLTRSGDVMKQTPGVFGDIVANVTAPWTGMYLESLRIFGGWTPTRIYELLPRTFRIINIEQTAPADTLTTVSTAWASVAGALVLVAAVGVGMRVVPR